MAEKVKELVPYFAYGANISPAKMRQRLSRMSLSCEPAQAIEDGVHLAFSHRGGFATLAKTEKQLSHLAGTDAHPVFQNPHGVLYQLSHQDLRVIAGHETGYKLSLMPVQTYQGHVVDANVFVSRPALALPRGLKPPLRYLELLKSGAREQGLSQEYQTWLADLHWVANDQLGPEYFATPSVLYTNVGMLTVILLLIAVVALS